MQAPGLNVLSEYTLLDTGSRSAFDECVLQSQQQRSCLPRQESPSRPETGTLHEKTSESAFFLEVSSNPDAHPYALTFTICNQIVSCTLYPIQVFTTIWVNFCFKKSWILIHRKKLLQPADSASLLDLYPQNDVDLQTNATLTCAITDLVVLMAAG